eukprot:scaffold13136_cov63-Phaeocystis_antarctica.AAC.1
MERSIASARRRQHGYRSKIGQGASDCRAGPESLCWSDHPGQTSRRFTLVEQRAFSVCFSLCLSPSGGLFVLLFFRFEAWGHKV